MKSLTSESIGSLETSDGQLHNYTAREYNSPVGKTYDILLEGYEEIGPFVSYSLGRAERTFGRWYNTKILGNKDLAD